MISISGKIWKQQKVNKNLIEKVKQDHGLGNILSQLIISRNLKKMQMKKKQRRKE